MHSETAVQPPGGWDFKSAYFAAIRAGRELAKLRRSHAEQAALDAAHRRYQRALHLLQRIRASLNDSSTAD